MTTSANPDCHDQHGNPTWSCIEFDGTGLWCDSCLAWAKREEVSRRTHMERSPVPPPKTPCPSGYLVDGRCPCASGPSGAMEEDR